MSNIDEMKNKISLELKNPVTQQGFEIICKKLSDLEDQLWGAKPTCNNCENYQRQRKRTQKSET